MERSIGEVLEKVKLAETDEEKLEILQTNKAMAKLQELATMLVDENIDFWDIPDSATYGFTNNVFGRCPTLMSEIKILRYFQKPTLVRQDRLIAMFLGLMDKLHPTEAEFVTCILNRNPLPYVSNEIVAEAFAIEVAVVETPVVDEKVVVEKPVEKIVTKAVEEELAVVEKPVAKKVVKKTTRKRKTKTTPKK